MKKYSINDKLNAILCYIFLLVTLPMFKKDKSSFLKKHLKRGKLLNIIIGVWLFCVIISYRILYFIPQRYFNITQLILYIISLIIALLIFTYQSVWIVKIIKKKG